MQIPLAIEAKSGETGRAAEHSIGSTALSFPSNPWFIFIVKIWIIKLWLDGVIYFIIIRNWNAKQLNITVKLLWPYIHNARLWKLRLWILNLIAYVYYQFAENWLESRESPAPICHLHPYLWHWNRLNSTRLIQTKWSMVFYIQVLNFNLNYN